MCIYISPNSFPGRVGSQEKPWRPASFCGGHRGIVSFSGKIFNTIEKVTSSVSKVACFCAHIAIPTGRPRIRQHYRGFGHVGRCRPQTVRVGKKARRKKRHFRNEGCFFPVREAGSSAGPANTIAELRHRLVECVEIYVGFETTVLRIANTHGDSRLRLP